MKSIIDLFKEVIGQEDRELELAIAKGEAPSCPVKFPEPVESKPRPKPEDFDGDYAPAIKIRLSGLQDGSDGNGCDRRTVIHALAIKPLNQGRLKRSPRQFLCTTSKASFGVSSSVGTPLTCDRCKKLVERHGLKPCTDSEIERILTRY